MIQRSQGLRAEGWKSQVVASSLRIAADGPACRHGTSLRIVAAAYPAAMRSQLTAHRDRARPPRRSKRPQRRPVPRQRTPAADGLPRRSAHPPPRPVPPQLTPALRSFGW